MSYGDCAPTSDCGRCPVGSMGHLPQSDFRLPKSHAIVAQSAKSKLSAREPIMPPKRLMVALLHGTGSYPPRLKGWQRLMRLRASHPPFRSPYFSMASYVYCERGGQPSLAGTLQSFWDCSPVGQLPPRKLSRSPFLGAQWGKST